MASPYPGPKTEISNSSEAGGSGGIEAAKFLQELLRFALCLLAQIR
jgi:hypothetical protein